jgi:heme exporter protein B
MTGVWALIARDLRLAARDSGGAATALGFYLVVVAMLPLGLGPDLNLLGRISPGVLWVALLLSALLAASRLFEADLEDGSLEPMAISGHPLEAVAIAKTAAHWCTVVVPLTVIAPILGLMLNLDIGSFGMLIATMLIGSPAISAIAMLGAALTLRSRRSGALVALLVLPLYIPTLIFGIGAVSAAASGPAGAAEAPILILAAISLAATAGAPFAAAAAIKAQLQ